MLIPKSSIKLTKYKLNYIELVQFHYNTCAILTLQCLYKLGCPDDFHIFRTSCTSNDVAFSFKIISEMENSQNIIGTLFFLYGATLQMWYAYLYYVNDLVLVNKIKIIFIIFCFHNDVFTLKNRWNHMKAKYMHRYFVFHYQFILL